MRPVPYQPDQDPAADQAKPSPGQSPSVATAPREDAAAGDDIRQIRSLLIQAKDRLQRTSNYRVVMTRQERVGSELLPVEEVILSVRRQPKAVRLE